MANGPRVLYTHAVTDPDERNLVQEGKNLANVIRNERQKRVLLAELGKSRRKEVAREIETTKQRMEECARSMKLRKS